MAGVPERYYALKCPGSFEAESLLLHVRQNGVRATIYESRFVVVGPTVMPGHYFANGGPLYEGGSMSEVVGALRAGERLPPVADAFAVTVKSGARYTFDVRPLAEQMAGWAYSILLGAPGVDYEKMPEGERQMWESKAGQAIKYVLDLLADQQHGDVGPRGGGSAY